MTSGQCNQTESSAGFSHDEKAARPAGAPKKKRRRRRRFVISAVLLLVVVIWSAPYLLSTGPGCDFIVSIVDNRFKGAISIGEISLSWLGPCRVTDLRIADLNGRKVLGVDEFKLDAGILGFVKEAENFGHASVASPDVTLFLNAEGVPSMTEALEPVEPSPERKGVPPAPKGSITVTNGLVRIVRADGRNYEIRGINTTINLDTLNRIEGKIDFAPAAGGRLSIKFDVSDLAAGGEVQLDGAKGSFGLATHEPAPLGPIVEFAAGQVGIDGAARIDLTGNIKDGGVTADFDVATLGLRAGGPERTDLRPTDLNLSGNLNATSKKISGNAKLTGEAANLKANFVYKPSSAPSELSWEDILAAVIGGKSITLPGVSLDIENCRIDLPKLARAVPSLLKVLPDVEITSGTVTTKKIAIRGGDRPSVRGRVDLSELRARKGDATISCRPVSLDLDAYLDKKTGLKIDTMKFVSAFGGVEDKGKAGDLATEFRLDLSEFHKELGKIFDFASAFPRGRFDGTVNLTRRGTERVDLVLDINTHDFEYAAGEKTIHIDKANIHQEGYLLLEDYKLLEAVATAGSVGLPKELSLTGSGNYHFKKKIFKYGVNVERADLQSLYRRFGKGKPAEPWHGRLPAGRQGLGRDKPEFAAAGRTFHEKARFSEPPEKKPADLPGLEGQVTGRIVLSRPDGKNHVKLTANFTGQQIAVNGKGKYSGAVELKNTFNRPAEDKPPISVGNVTFTNLRLDGKSLTGQPIKLKWSGLKLDPEMRWMDIASANLESEPSNLLAKEVHLVLSDDFKAKGEVEISANLAKGLAFAGQLLKWERTPQIFGDLTWNGVSNYSGGIVRLSGDGEIEELVVGSGERISRQGKVTFDHVTNLDHGKKRITLEKTELVSKALSLKMGGTIDLFGSEWLLDLAGSYEGSWEDLTLLLHEFVPETRAKVLLVGKISEQIRITGPARNPKVRPAFREVKANTALGWARADVFGIPFGQARLSPVLEDAQVRIPKTVIASGDGTVRLAGTIDMQGDDPVFRLPGKVRVLENLELTPQLNKDLLTRFNPIFAELAGVEGRISLETKDLVLPLGENIKKTGSGAGHLDLRKLKVRPKGILTELLQLGLGGPQDQLPVLVRGVDFKIRDGRIEYEDFTLFFPEGFDLKFRGSVGFDDTLDLAVSVPLSVHLLEKLGISGPTADYVRVLSGLRVDIPIIGSRFKHRLDFAKVDVKPLIEQAIKKLLAEQTGKLLEDLLKDRKRKEKPKKDEDPKDKDKDSKDKVKDLDPLLDSLLDLLKESRPRRDSDERNEKP